MTRTTSDEQPLMSDGFRDRGAQATRLEAFVDAAFAFALTMVVVAGNEIPRSVDALVLAMKSIPAYAASFLLIMRFWSAHADWSQRYGLDDVASRNLGLLLVFLVLIFVYPMKMVFASLFNAISGGYLPANFSINAITDIPVMFITFAVALGLMGLVMSALYLHAWRQRVVLGLDQDECAITHFELLNWAAVPMVAALSLALALLVPAHRDSGWWLGAPGFVFFLLNFAPFLFRRLVARRPRRERPG